MKYVSLHSHTHFSVYDAIGTPKEFFNQVLENGGDALAVTDHGSMNGLGYSVSAANDLKKRGVHFKPIYGTEAYIYPDLNDWRTAYENKDNENSQVIEDENESKSKYYDPIKRRHHLVINVLNNKGLENLFTLVSLSYKKENFYRFPRMDFDMLRKYNDGLAINTACVHPETIVQTNYGPCSIICLKFLQNTNLYVEVLSYNLETQQKEMKPVRWVSPTKKTTKLIKITLANGQCLKCTDDHKILTRNRGWVAAGNLTKNDTIECKEHTETETNGLTGG